MAMVTMMGVMLKAAEKETEETKKRKKRKRKQSKTTSNKAIRTDILELDDHNNLLQFPSSSSAKVSLSSSYNWTTNSNDGNAVPDSTEVGRQFSSLFFRMLVRKNQEMRSNVRDRREEGRSTGRRVDENAEVVEIIAVFLVFRPFLYFLFSAPPLSSPFSSVIILHLLFFLFFII